MAKIIKGLRVTVKDHEDISRALRRLKNKVKDNGNLKIVQEKEYYEQPSLVRKREKAVGRARHLKRISKQQLPQIKK
jgi:small subunit ribosomal protein S21